MSLVQHLPTDESSVDGLRLFNILWLSATALVVWIVILLLLQRLGLPLAYAVGGLVVWTGLFALVMSFVGRSMTSSHFFFANNMGVASQLGVSGLGDWVSGAFLARFFGISFSGQIVVAVSLALALMLHAALFARAIQYAKVATVPGFFAWRYRSQLLGVVVLFVTSAISFALMAAEFELLQILASDLPLLSGEMGPVVLVIFAVLPALFGGWLSLALINSVLAVWMLIMVLVPAIAVGLLPGLIRSDLVVEAAATTLPVLEFAAPQWSLFEPGQGWVSLALLMYVLTCGLCCLPTAFSRSSLHARPGAALEGIAWSSLGLFLIFSAAPLSLLLIAGDAASPAAAVLSQNPVLHALPYFAILIAVYNAFSATLLVASGSVVRALRRSRNLDPGEQSMFSTRMLAVVLAVGLLVMPAHILPNPVDLLIWAVMLGACSLFWPLVFSIWISKIPAVASGLSVVASPALALVLFYDQKWQPVEATAVGMALGFLILVAGGILLRLRGKPHDDTRLAELRRSDAIS